MPGKRSLFLILLFVPVMGLAQESNNTNWRTCWELKSGAITNLVRSYAIKCGSDIDQDGKGEILLNCNETTNFFLLEAVENDSFAAIWQAERPHQSELRCLAVSDWDADGKEEISIILDAAMGDLPGAVYEWSGEDNGFPSGEMPTSEFDLPRNNSGAVCVEASSILTNLDADPGPEWILPYFRGSGVSMVILELAGGNLSDYGWDFDYLDTTPGQVRTVEVGDLDNDGSMEIVAMDRENKYLRFIKNTGEDSYQLIKAVRADVVNPNYSCNAVESLRILNYDGGMPELYILDGNGRIYVMKHTGDLSSLTSANFSTLLDLSDISTERGFAAGDLDRDGKPDLYFGNSIANKGVVIYDFEYEGGDVTNPLSYSLYEVWRHDFVFGGTLEVGNVRIGNQLGEVDDLDGDGFPELVIAFGTTQPDLPAILILENFSEPAAVTETPHKNVPDKFDLGQNFPNPFNPVTEIPYEIANQGFVKLEIFSLQGQCVALLVNDFQKAGRFGAYFHSTSLAAGEYFCRLTFDGFWKQKKMLLLK